MDIINIDNFFELCSWFNELDVRYVIVKELPAIEDVYDRRCVYIVMDSVDCILLFTPYTCVSGVWVQVDTASLDVSELLGKVDGYE